jgi:tryptophan halogenase
LGPQTAKTPSGCQRGKREDAVRQSDGFDAAALACLNRFSPRWNVETQRSHSHRRLKPRGCDRTNPVRFAPIPPATRHRESGMTPPDYLLFCVFNSIPEGRMEQVKSVIVVGGGTAGFMAALAVKMKLPALAVTVVRSPEIGIIGVGEGSAPPFTRFLHQFLRIPIGDFVRATRPGLKIGTCFLWGPQPRFFFPFGPHIALKANDLPLPIGYYLAFGDSEAGTPLSAKMQANRTFDFDPNNSLRLNDDFAYHVENDRFAAYLETSARLIGVEVIDGTIEAVRQDEHGITGLTLADGRSLAGDLYVDCSGFRSLLLGKTLGELRVEYHRTLACDRAVVGGWPRPAGLPMVGYTVAETMDSGWCWRIDHPDRINRGYVYSSAFISDDDAEQELRQKNPAVGPTRVVKFVSGRYARSWVKNVVAIGNASGFVEPLEATSLAITASRCQLLAELLIDGDRRVAPTMVNLFNDNTARIWDSIRDFLSLHYRFNTRLDTPFWRHCREKTDMGDAQPTVDYYRHAGPSTTLACAFLDPGDVFSIASYYAILTGQRVPLDRPYQPTAAELSIWDRFCKSNAAGAQSAATVEQALAIIGGGRQI